MIKNSSSILFTAPQLNKVAKEILESAGYKVILTQQDTSTEDIAELVKHNPIEAIISRSIRLDERVFKEAMCLKLICKHGTGVDNIDIDSAQKYGIKVVKTMGVNAISVAEHTLALILASAKNIVKHANSVANGEWDRTRWKGIELSDKTLALIGFGFIGQNLARISEQLFKNIIVYDPYANPSHMKNKNIKFVDLEDVFSVADIISLHCPLTKENKNMINHDVIKKMKKNSILINTARGELVNEADVLKALKEEMIFAIGLDTVVNESATDISKKGFEMHDLRSHQNAIITPHIAASTYEAMNHVAIKAANNTISILAGKSIAESDYVI